MGRGKAGETDVRDKDVYRHRTRDLVVDRVRDKLSDLKDADRYDEGCVTIPVTYSSDRNSCTSEGPKVHEWCDGKRGPVTCGSEEETRRTKRDIENAERRITARERRAVTFKDPDGRVRPVAPFLELWGRDGDDDDWRHLTMDDLAGARLDSLDSAFGQPGQRDSPPPRVDT